MARYGWPVSAWPMNGGGPDIEALRVTREESRSVLDHQLALLNDLDDNATRTVWTAVILSTAAGVAGVNGLRTLPPDVLNLFAGDAIYFLSSAVIGVSAYTASDLSMGIGPGHREEVFAREYPESEWLELLIAEYDQWFVSMRSTNARNTWVLACQGLLVERLRGGS